MSNGKTLEISWGAILKIGIAVALLYFLYNIGGILVWVLFGLIISILFNPVIDFLEEKRIPRVLGAVLSYLLFFSIFAFSIYLAALLFIDEIKQFLAVFPQYFEKASPILRALGFQAFENAETFLKASGESFSKMSDNIFSALFSFFGGVFATLFVIVMAFFISLEKEMVEKVLINIFPKKYESAVSSIWEKCQKKVAGWFGVRVLSCFFVGIATYIVLLLFKVEYPFSLGLFAGILNFVPYIGPLITGILLSVIVLPLDFLKFIFVLIAFILIQQIENNVISPILMKKFVGMPPVLVLFSIVVGGKIWGFLGAILVIPLVGIIFEFLKEFLEKKRAKESLV